MVDLAGYKILAAMNVGRAKVQGRWTVHIAMGQEKKFVIIVMGKERFLAVFVRKESAWQENFASG